MTEAQAKAYEEGFLAGKTYVLAEVDGWLDEMKKYDWGDLTDYETHEVGIPKGYKRAVNELRAKLNQLKGTEWVGVFAPNGGHDPNNPYPLKRKE